MADEEPPEPTARRAVLKLGGEVVADLDALDVVLREVAELTRRGWRFVLVHGAGPQAGQLQARLGLGTTKVAGRRVTDDATLQVVKQVLGGEVNIDLVAAVLHHGLDAVGLTGVSGRLLVARRVDRSATPGSDEPIDYGHVGEIQAVRVEVLHRLWSQGSTPVVSPIAVGDAPRPDGRNQILNVNADSAAVAIASALQVDHLFLVTAVPGVLRSMTDPSSRIPRLTPVEAAAAIAAGTVQGGMIVKLQDAMAHLDGGIGTVHILAPGPGALLQEATQPGRVGTVLVPDEIDASCGAPPPGTTPSRLIRHETTR